MSKSKDNNRILRNSAKVFTPLSKVVSFFVIQKQNLYKVINNYLRYLCHLIFLFKSLK